MSIANFVKYRWNDIKTAGRKCRGKLERKVLKNDDFTIISNNCWGGWVYRFYGLPYTSPTVGNFMIADDYLKFVKNLKFYLNQDPVFILPEEAHRADDLKKTVPKFGEYPIGRIKDIDIHFLHDSSAEKALATWKRRAERVNYNKIIIKFSTQNLWSEENCREFAAFEFPNKILFTANPIAGIQNAVVFRRDRGLNDTRDEGAMYQKYINMTRYIRKIRETGKYFE